jgi:hypothetical protein
LEKGGFKQAIEQAEQALTAEQSLEGSAPAKLEPEFGDEMRLGLQGQVRRVLAPKGVKVVQPVQREYQYEYLLLSVNPKSGKLTWDWLARMKQDLIKPVLQAWAIPLMIWDGAGVHRGKALAALPGKRIIQPPYSPELNPAERVFQEVRRAIEGKVYPSLLAKRQAAEVFLRKLAADPNQVTSLCFYPWIQQTLCDS